MTTQVEPVIFERYPDRRAEHLRTADLECNLCHRGNCDALFKPVAGSLSAEELERLDKLVRRADVSQGRSPLSKSYYPERGFCKDCLESVAKEIRPGAKFEIKGEA